MNYDEFIASKIKRVEDAGFEVESLNEGLFDFQRHIVSKALRKGRYAIFADCGLGKTFMQLEWAHHVNAHTGKPVLILAPLAVSSQTIKEGEKFGISVSRVGEGDIQITNYEQLKNVDVSIYSGVVLDESSILKNFTGKYKNLIIDSFKKTPYKLACTATPSPNDMNEIGNHSEFLGVLDAPDMRARWFVRDEGMGNYRLKGHAEDDFFAWVSSWGTMISKPSDIGFDSEGYDLPDLNFIEKQVKTGDRDNGLLFNDVAVSATNFNKELRLTLLKRMDQVREIVNTKPNEPFIIWVKQNEEGDKITAMIDGAVQVKGSDSTEVKEDRLLGFARGEFRVLVTKTKIAQFGLNYQHCNNQIFASLDFSFEGLYQAIRRSYRFGQANEVNIYMITTDTMQNVIGSIQRKQSQFTKMQNKMKEAINEFNYGLTGDISANVVKTDQYEIHNNDCVKAMKDMPSDFVDLSVFSPPFSTIFTYSNNIHDMGNCENDEEFFEQNEFMLKELYRIMRPGRIVAVHTKDLARYKESSGFSGLYNFTGLYHQAMERAGFKYHSKVTIWTDPVLEMQRTKTQRLLYKQLRKDSSYTGIGMAEYVTLFRKWEGDESEWIPITNKTRDNFSLETWQKWASPVWMDIQRTDVLNDWRGAKDARDEKHICPLQLSVIERIVKMWSNQGELVFSPFMGIGSEGYESLKYNRKFLGVELKPEYFQKAIRNLNAAVASQNQLSLL